MEDDYSNCTEKQFNATLTKYGMLTSNALVVTASKIPNDFGNTWYFNIDLALNILRIFCTFTSPEWMFASWEINGDMVIHLHLVFEHKRRVDTATRKLQITNSYVYRRDYFNHQTGTNTFISQLVQVLYQKSDYALVN